MSLDINYVLIAKELLWFISCSAGSSLLPRDWTAVGQQIEQEIIPIIIIAIHGM